MTKWLRRLGAALMMGLAWAVVWLPIGLVIGMIIDPDGAMDEPWVVVGTYPGFLCGVIFSAVVGMGKGGRRFAELSLHGVATWGAVSGLLGGGVWLVLALLSDPPQWLLNVVVVGSLTLLSAVSGVGSAFLARVGKNDARGHVV